LKPVHEKVRLSDSATYRHLDEIREGT
jgi:hypothetical protein